ncbi:class I SAM-dependent methyltransferase [Flavimaricola marinus]|uniref:Ribosomal RNA small subunit methyltransferase C n=1 Tax=Flavimaricola marinus TaxID=1819565 RepID=A0A238LAS1_9RHOB|nr:class I SAM-dependent methyltransferase [Flavimaricola marinus]SMY06728.1 Ribosomal RNA small subunit methyltransferase C [Flavimaricola marinus]
MSTSRLTTAFDDGLLTAPAGKAVVMRPPLAYDLAALSPDQADIVHSFAPDVSYWETMGYAVSKELTPSDLVIVVVPRAKALARAMLAEAVTKAPVVVVDGQKTDGVDSLWRDLRKRLGDLPSITKSHGRLFWFKTEGVDLSDWAAPPPSAGPEGFVTQPGVFSDGAIDRGSALLADALPGKLPSRVADLGAGWGYLSAAILKREGVTHLDLVEAEALALDCARQNITDPRAHFHWADATQFTPEAKYGAIVTNPPFHTGRAADPSLGRAFITAAAAMLVPGGQLWLVANRHLPYEAHLREAFVRVDEAGGDSAFKVFCAIRPKKA